MNWEEALQIIEARVNAAPVARVEPEEPIDPNEPPPAPDPTWKLKVYADVSSSPMGLKVAVKKSSDENWEPLGFLAVAEKTYWPEMSE